MISVSIPVSIGELYDKISILEIKVEKLEGVSRLNAKKELDLLCKVASDLDVLVEQKLFDDLRGVNQELWIIEDQIRDHERHNDFGENFIALARSVYTKNDRRASIKRLINQLTSSEIVEEKSYKSY
jgi:hypothetical protein